MEYAFSVLMWSPVVFWAATMHELIAASDGYIKANTPPKGVDDPATMEEFEMMKKKFG